MVRLLTARARLPRPDLPGQSMVEFALVIPVFMLLSVGVVDLGRGVFQYAELVNGAREGARVGTYDQTSSTIKNAVKSRTTLGLTDSDIAVTCYSGFTTSTVSCSSVTLGDGVKVTVTKSFQPITGRIIAIVGSSLSLTSSAMRAVQ